MLRRLKKNIKQRRVRSSSDGASGNGIESQSDRLGYLRSSPTSTGNEQPFDPLEYLKKIEELANFDACVETSDALAVSSAYTRSPAKIDRATGLRDCSVLVGPDGDLLLLPQEQDISRRHSRHTNDVRNDTKVEDNSLAQDPQTQTEHSAHETHDESGTTKTTAETKITIEDPLLESYDRTAIFNLNGNADCESAIFMGDDLSHGGEKLMNGFSAVGWSTSAASLAIRQSEESLRTTANYAEELILARKEQAAKVSLASDHLRDTTALLAAQKPPKKNLFIGSNNSRGQSNSSDNSWVVTDTAEIIEYSSTRLGPLVSASGSLYAATIALERYHSDVSESEANRWRLASLSNPSSESLNGVSQKNIGVLPALCKAADQAAERSYKRERALREIQRRADVIENRLAQCKDSAKQRWESVHRAEDRVTKIVEQRTLERAREREHKRIEEFDKKREEEEGNTDLGATQNEIWDLVSSMNELMENGSFEPTGLPNAPLSTLQDRGKVVDEAGNGEETPTHKNEEMESIPIPSRTELENQYNLPDLRASAVAASDLIEDTAGSFLNVLSILDTTRRSARVAAETCLLSVANAQSKAIRSLIALERESIEERLCHIVELERIAENIDVRQDLNNYIETDKREQGGLTLMGDDDDGGIASALAVLSSHVEGGNGVHEASKFSSDGWDESCNNDEEVTADKIEDTVEFLFGSSALESDKGEDYETFVEFLSSIASERKTAQSRFHRSTMCYAINQKRSSNAELKGRTQFDGICRVFEAILTGCDTEPGGVANAKMLMMLSQSFYIMEAKKERGETVNNEESRENRIFVKTFLVDHDFWKDEEFWDQALYQCVAESLTHSGVIASFDRSTRGVVNKSEWTETHKFKWHDLTQKERSEAASQVHAVVFAQLGALAHSMIEFGCGIDRSSAFVRRMAIRNQLPISQRRILLQHLLSRNETDGD